MSEFVLRTQHLSKRFYVFKQKGTLFRTLGAFMRREKLKREFWALRDISFELKRGERLAVVGKNGSGKTTLLRLLSGIYDKTDGEIEVTVPPRVLFSLPVGLNGDLSVIDNMYLCAAVHGISRSALNQAIEEILAADRLGELRFSPLKELSTGQQQRLALSVFFRHEGELLILDEGFYAVDQDFLKACDAFFCKLAEEQKTLIMTSHDPTLLRRYCTRAIWLEAGRIRMDGDADEVIDRYAAEG